MDGSSRTSCLWQRRQLQLSYHTTTRAHTLLPLCSYSAACWWNSVQWPDSIDQQRGGDAGGDEEDWFCQCEIWGFKVWSGYRWPSTDPGSVWLWFVKREQLNFFGHRRCQIFPWPVLPLSTRLLHQHRKMGTSGEEAACHRQIINVLGGFYWDKCDFISQDRNTNITRPEKRTFTEGIFIKFNLCGHTFLFLILLYDIFLWMNQQDYSGLPMGILTGRVHLGD